MTNLALTCYAHPEDLREVCYLIGEAYLNG